MYSRSSLLILTIICLMITECLSGQVGIGTTDPDASTVLEISSTEKGFLPPRMTSFQRDAIVNPADGLMIFNTTSGCPNYHYAGIWYEYCGIATCGFPVTFTYNGSSVTYGTVTSANNRCWLDRNLGATQVATSSTDATAYGDLFQWGRLDDGHQVRTSPTTLILSNSDEPGHNMFIRTVDYPYDWRSPQNNNLWQGEGGTNNPCPEGFRLPTQAEWDIERLSWSSNNAEGAFASPLQLTVAGYRDGSDGFVYTEGSYGDYWSSSIGSFDSWFLSINSNGANMNNYVRAFGMSVRCIKD